MDAIQLLQGDLDREIAKARSVVDEADKEGRALTDAERVQAEQALAEVARLKSRIQEEKDKQHFRDAVDGFHAIANGPDPNPVREDPAANVRGKTLGDALISSEAFKMWQAKAKDAGRVPRFPTPPVSVPWPYRAKAAGDPVLESDNAAVFAGGPGPLTTFLGLETPGFVQFRLTIADLIPSVQVTTGPGVTYPTVKTRTQVSATPQTEGQAKPGGEYEFDMVTEELVTLAGWVKMSTQFLEDAPGLAAYINADLPLQIRQNEESYIAGELYSDVTATADGTGIGGSNGYDAILEAITTIQEAGGDPNGMIVTPMDWASLLVTKNTGGDENYTGGGPFSPTNNPWNLRVVITPSATQGLPLVGDFTRGAKEYRKGGLSVESTNTDQDDFIKNKITIRAEERLVHGTTYPEFFCTADIGTS